MTKREQLIKEGHRLADRATEILTYIFDEIEKQANMERMHGIR